MSKILKKISSKVVKRIFVVIIGFIIFGIIGVNAANLIASSDIAYDNTNSGTIVTTVQGAIDELYNGLLVGKEKIAEALTGKGIETTTDNTFEEIANNIDTLSTNKYNEGYNAGSSSTGKYHLGLFGITDGASTAGSVMTSFKIIDNTYFTNNSGTITCNKTGNYVIFGDGYFNYYVAYIYNSSGSQKTSYVLNNQRYNTVTLNAGDYIKFVETDTVSGNMHRNVGIFSL